MWLSLSQGLCNSQLRVNRAILDKWIRMLQQVAQVISQRTRSISLKEQGQRSPIKVTEWTCNKPNTKGRIQAIQGLPTSASALGQGPKTTKQEAVIYTICLAFNRTKSHFRMHSSSVHTPFPTWQTTTSSMWTSKMENCGPWPTGNRSWWKQIAAKAPNLLQSMTTSSRERISRRCS